jgi:TatD DNase family protein
MTEGDAGTWAHFCNGLLRLIRTDFECQSNAELLEHVASRGYFPHDTSPFHLSLAQRLLFRLWERRNGLELSPLEIFSVQPPSTVACLLHPKVLACILCHCSAETIRQTSSLEDRPREEALPRPARLPRTVDAHIHLDALGPDFQSHLGSVEDCALRYEYLISNYVFPARWNAWDEVVDSHPHIYATFGIHPTLCGAHPEIVTENTTELRQRLLGPRCVALGEIGLDYLRQSDPRHQQRQRSALDQLLCLRPRNLPVVVHCRGVGALEDCLELMRSRVRPHTVVVQVHCFQGSRADVDRWTSSFPNAMFSFSMVSLSLTGAAKEEHERAARSLSLDQVLLESDAPYVRRPSRVTNQLVPVSPRRDLFLVGAWLGQLKGLCPSIILEAARLNAHRAFALPGV